MKRKRQFQDAYIITIRLMKVTGVYAGNIREIKSFLIALRFNKLEIIITINSLIAFRYALPRYNQEVFSFVIYSINCLLYYYK